MVGGPDHMFRLLDAQHPLIGKEGLNILGRVVAYLELRVRRLRDNAIVYIREIGNLNDLEASRTEKTSQDILEDESPKIANMGEVVDGRPARIHPHLARMQRYKWLVLPSERIVEDDIAH